MHDTTKLHPEELVQYRRQFYPLNDREKGAGFKEAWEHHKRFNPHHWETWTKEKYTDPYEWEIHCAHMVIDWMAMGYKFGDTAQEYYENNKEKFTFLIMQKTLFTKYSNGSTIVEIDTLRPHLTIQGKKAVHIVPVETFKDVSRGKLPISAVEDIDDFMPQIISEWIEYLGI